MLTKLKIIVHIYENIHIKIISQKNYSPITQKMENSNVFVSKKQENVQTWRNRKIKKKRIISGFFSTDYHANLP